MIGISPSAWEEAQIVMGEVQAATVVAAILQRGAAIASAGGYLRDLTREGQGRAVLARADADGADRQPQAGGEREEDGVSANRARRWALRRDFSAPLSRALTAPDAPPCPGAARHRCNSWPPAARDRCCDCCIASGSETPRQRGFASDSRRAGHAR